MNKTTLERLLRETHEALVACFDQLQAQQAMPDEGNFDYYNQTIENAAAALDHPPMKKVIGKDYSTSTLSSASDFISLAQQAIQIANSKATWETKYELIFSEDIAGKIRDTGLMVSYHDPDTSYEEDLKAYVEAARERAIDLYKATQPQSSPGHWLTDNHYGTK